MVVVLFVLFAWFCIQVLINLPRKLPLVANVLLFMGIEIVDINKLTIVGFEMQLFEINVSIPAFLSLILHNDFTVSFLFITYANLFLTTRSAGVRWGISVYTYAAVLGVGMALRWNGILIDRGWTLPMEMIMILLQMGYMLLLGRLFQWMAAKEGWVR